MVELSRFASKRFMVRENSNELLLNLLTVIKNECTTYLQQRDDMMLSRMRQDLKSMPRKVFADRYSASLRSDSSILSQETLSRLFVRESLILHMCVEKYGKERPFTMQVMFFAGSHMMSLIKQIADDF
jgi:hypothetical protein